MLKWGRSTQGMIVSSFPARCSPGCNSVAFVSVPTLLGKSCTQIFWRIPVQSRNCGMHILHSILATTACGTQVSIDPIQIITSGKHAPLCCGYVNTLAHSIGAHLLVNIYYTDICIRIAHGLSQCLS